jgi:hypothetical protein
VSILELVRFFILSQSYLAISCIMIMKQSVFAETSKSDRKIGKYQYYVLNLQGMLHLTMAARGAVAR